MNPISNYLSRLVISAGLILLIDLVAVITLMPVFTCMNILLHDGPSPGLMVLCQLLLLFAIYALSQPARQLRDLWTLWGS